MDNTGIAILVSFCVPLLLPLLFKRPFFRSVLLSAVLAGAAVFLCVALGYGNGMHLLIAPPLAGLLSLKIFRRKDAPPRPPKGKANRGKVKLTPVPDQFNRAHEVPRKTIRMSVDE